MLTVERSTRHAAARTRSPEVAWLAPVKKTTHEKEYFFERKRAAKTDQCNYDKKVLHCEDV
jgi:hypothetical protein